MPDMNRAVWVRKARPITGLASTARAANDRLQCKVRFAVGNGQPVASVLVPVVKPVDKWLLSGTHGPIPSPGPKDVEVTAGTAHPAGGGIAEIDAPWPANAQHALLLLLHDQAELVGDDVFRRLVLLHLDPQARFQLEEGLVTLGVRVDALEGPAAIGELEVAVAYCLRQIPASQLDLAVLDQANALALASPSGPEESFMASRGLREKPEKGAANAQDQVTVARNPRFVLASCLYPAGMLDGTVRARDAAFEAADFGPAQRPLWRLSERCRSDRDIAAVILAGDQVYVDATAGLFDAKAMADGLRVAYERLHRNLALTWLLKSARRILPLMDDHEIHENWDGPEGDGDRDLAAAKDAYLREQRSMWPPSVQAEKDDLWVPCELEGFHFFFADTRTERDLRTHANWDSARIYGDAQARALHCWIRDRSVRPPQPGGEPSDPRPAFVVSPAILVPRLLLLQGGPAMALHVDAWSGFPRSFQELLVCLYDASASHVVFLSGDEHLSCIARISIRRDDVSDKVVSVYSVHSSAVYAPFVFANAHQEDFSAPETFAFTSGPHSFTCRVEALAWCAGDGFAVLTPFVQDSGRWTLKVQFDRETSPPPGDFDLPF